MALDTVIVKFQADVDSLRKELEGVKKQLKDTENQAEETGKALEEEVGGAANKLSNAFKNIGIAVAAAFSTREILKFIDASVDLAAKAQGVKRAFDSLNTPGLLKNLQEATKGTVSNMQLMQVAVRANNFKIPLEQLAKYLKFAQQRATETGQSIDYLVESIVTGIGRKSPMILDNLGIKAKDLSAEMGKVGDMATAVGNIIDREFTQVGETTLTTAEKQAQLTAEIENLKLEIGTGLLPIANELLGWFSEFLKNLNFSIQGVQNFRKELRANAKEDMRAAELDLFLKWLENNKDRYNNLSAAAAAYNKIAKQNINSYAQQLLQLKGLSPAQQAAFENYKAQVLVVDQYVQKQKDANKTIGEQTDIVKTNISEFQKWRDELNKLNAPGGTATDSIVTYKKNLEDLFPVIAKVIANQMTFKGELKDTSGYLGDMQTVALTSKEIFDIMIEGFTQLTQIQTDNASFQKSLALFSIIIAQAEAVANAVTAATKAAARTGSAIPYFALLGTIIASVTKTISGAKQLLNVPVPQAAFAEGVVDLKGRGTETSDSILARLSKGESVITAKATRLDKGLFEAANKLQLEDYITKNYVLPVLREQEKESQAAFDDYRLYLALVKGQSKDERNTTRIVQAIKETGVRRYDWN